jgi:hypothetical protein
MEAAGATCPPLANAVGLLQMACDLTPNEGPHRETEKADDKSMQSKEGGSGAKHNQGFDRPAPIT